MTTQEQILCSKLVEAITLNRKAKFTYTSKDGKAEEQKIITVECYLIGQLKNNNIALSAYFLPTCSQTTEGQTEGWRLYLLKNISEIKIMEEQLTIARPNYNPQDKRMKEIIFCLSGLNEIED